MQLLFSISYVVHCCVPDCHRRWTCLTDSHKKLNYFLSILSEILSYLNIIKQYPCHCHRRSTLQLCEVSLCISSVCDIHPHLLGPEIRKHKNLSECAISFLAVLELVHGTTGGMEDVSFQESAVG